MRELINFLAPLNLDPNINEVNALNIPTLRQRFNALSDDEKLLLRRYVAPEILNKLESNIPSYLRNNLVSNILPRFAPINNVDLIALRDGLTSMYAPYVSARTGGALLMEKLLMAAGAEDANSIDAIINTPRAKQGLLLRYVNAAKQELNTQDENALTALLTSNNNDNQKKVAQVIGKYATQLAVQAAASVNGQVFNNTVKHQDFESKMLLANEAKKGIFNYIDTTPDSAYMKWQEQLKLACESANMGFFTSIFHDEASVTARDFNKSKWFIIRALNAALDTIDLRGLFITREIGIATLLSAAFFPPLAPALAVLFMFSAIADAASITYTALKDGMNFIGSTALGLYSLVEDGMNLFLGTVSLCYRATITIPMAITNAIAPNVFSKTVSDMWNEPILSLPNDPNSMYSKIKEILYNSAVTGIYTLFGHEADLETQKGRSNIVFDNLEKTIQGMALFSQKADHQPNQQQNNNPVLPERAVAENKTWAQKFFDSIGIGNGSNNRGY